MQRYLLLFRLSGAVSLPETAGPELRAAAEFIDSGGGCACGMSDFICDAYTWRADAFLPGKYTSWVRVCTLRNHAGDVVGKI